VDIQKIKSILLAEGNRLLNSESSFLEFSSNKEYNTLLADIEHYPHAFVIGCLMDRQVKAEVAWGIPFHLLQQLGDFHFSTLACLSQDDCITHMTSPAPLHRFPTVMGQNLFFTVQRIKDQYGGDASNIWKGNLSSAEIVCRFLQFAGVGPKIATMATNILARDFKIPMSDYYSIDISSYQNNL
jgi:endonuclease III